MSKKLNLVLISMLLLATSCDNPVDSSEPESTINNSENATSTTSSESSQSETTSSSSESSSAEANSRYKTDYTFKKFKKLNSEEKEEIVDGLTHYSFNLTKSNDTTTVIHTLEVDMSKLTIKAGTQDNVANGFKYQRETPYQCALDYEAATTKAVYASINADFFGSYCCNAFVKDGYIIKDSHNDNGSYDYTKEDDDVPASAPLLFGIDANNNAQIAPIVNYSGSITDSATKKSVIQSKLYYKILGNGTSLETSKTFVFTTSNVTLTKGASYLVCDISNGPLNMSVESVASVTARTPLKAPGTNKAYIYATASNSEAINFINSFKANDAISLSVNSADGTWNNYQTILGGRHALIIDGEVPDTVAKEYMNGAKSEDVPRSAVGIKEDGTVVIFSVESLYYGGINSANDTHGVTLVQLAEFMYYYNIKDAVNFDGGGSTQLVTKKVLGGDPSVIVRSSDSGSTDALSSRKVMNSLLVCEK